VIQKTFAAGALLVAASGASALTATTALNNIQILVFDLTPLDGIAPSFNVLSGGSSYANAYTESGLDAWANTSPAAVHLTATGLDLAATSTGTGVGLGSYSLAASASNPALSIYGYASAYSGVNFNVEVGAGTLVLVTADANLAANGAGALNGTYVISYSEIYFNNRSNGNATSSTGNVEAYAGYGHSNLSPSYNGQVSASISNFGATTVSGTLSFYAQTRVESQMAPVPEPSSSAMLLSGLGVAFGVACRRRERRA
jgi:hypothetical protein